MNSDFIMKVTTTVNCIADVSFTPPSSMPSKLRYEIGAKRNSTVIETFKDSVAQSAQINGICGPTAYKLYLTDAKAQSKSVYPDFITYEEKTRDIQLFTENGLLAGTYYLMLDIFYSLFANEPETLHHYQIV